MKRTILFIILLISQLAYAEEWNWQNPVPQGNTLWKTAFYNEWYGYTVGDFGTIMVTYDQGATWQLQYEGVTDNLRDLFVADSITVWAVGDNGTILSTTNGGAKWNEQSSGVLTGLNSVYFIDHLNGWACGDAKTILRTTDGGSIWEKQTVPFLTIGSNLNGIFFTTVTEGWCIGLGGTILHSTDAGISWAPQFTTGQTLLRIKFFDSVSGLAVGDNGSIYSTNNSGTNWTQVTSGTTMGLNDILFVSLTDFLISGDNGTLLHSTNAGSNWSDQSLSTYASLNGIAAAPNLLFAVGENGVLARRIGTSSWNFLNSGDNRAINWITFYDFLNGWGVGQYGIILHTTDGGKTWSEQVNGITGDSFYGAEAADANNMWTVGDLGVLLHTSDAGQHWVQQSTYTTNTLLSVSFIDNLHGWVVGDVGELLQTVNGGNLWTHKSSGVSDILFGVKFKSILTGWIVGDNGIIRKTTDGGNSWNSQSSGVTDALFSVDFLDAQRGYCAGANGVILKTTNGGSLWTKQSTGTQRNIYVVGGISDNALWAVGDSGHVLFSSDAGSIWHTQFAKMGFDVFGLKVGNDSTAWLSGDNGTIMQYGNATPPEVAAITVLTPNGGEVWKIGTLHNILWISKLVSYVSIDYSIDAGNTWTNLASNVSASTGLYPWLIPDSYTTQALIRIYNSENPALFDMSNGSFTLTSATTMLNVDAGWNLVSLSVIPQDPLSNSIFIGASSEIFSYQDTYIAVDTVEEGFGYWVKYDFSTAISTPGKEVSSLTIQLAPRWNLIGTINYSIPVSAVKATPAGNIASPFFGYKPGTGYTIADSLFPGMGYWLKTADSGELKLYPETMMLPLTNLNTNLDDFNSIIFKDVHGNVRTLYFETDSASDNLYAEASVPPLSPEDVYDVRFSSNRLVERLLYGNPLPILMQSVEYPLTLSLMNRKSSQHSYRLVERTGGRTPQYYSFENSEIIITSQSGGILTLEMVSDDVIPDAFLLHQNYPNPFNPTTSIRYELPIESQVSIAIYNVIGEEVTHLVEARQTSGKYEVLWNGTDEKGITMTSGIYFVRMKAGNFSETKKLILIK